MHAYRGDPVCKNNLLIARSALEKQLLAGLQEKVLHRDVIDYTFARFDVSEERIGPNVCRYGLNGERRCDGAGNNVSYAFHVPTHSRETLENAGDTEASAGSTASSYSRLNGRGERVKPAKQIVFRYNGDPATEEIDLDMDGDKSIPAQGSFVERKGERWKVVQVNIEANLSEPFQAPVHRVFLTNKL
jgi:hypothetical protein